MFSFSFKMDFWKSFSQLKLSQWVLICPQEQSSSHPLKSGMEKNHDGSLVDSIYKWVVEQEEEDWIKKVWPSWCSMKRWNPKSQKTCSKAKVTTFYQVSTLTTICFLTVKDFRILTVITFFQGLSFNFNIKLNYLLL